MSFPFIIAILLPLDGINYFFGLLSSIGSYFFFWSLCGCLLAPIGFVFGILTRFSALLHGLLFFFVSLGLFLPMKPFFVREDSFATNPSNPQLSLLLANVERGNQSAAKAILDLTARKSPDIIALLEATPMLSDGLRSLRNYPFVIDMVEESHFGMRIYSKYPLGPHQEIFPLEEYVRAYNGVVQVNNTPVNLLVLHPPPPTNTEPWRLHREVFQRARLHAQSTSGRLLIVGDLNATPHSYVYRSLIQETDLVNAMARSGNGWLRTWNMHTLFLRLPIDHMLFQGDISVAHFELLAPIESDHLPLFASFSLTRNSHRREQASAHDVVDSLSSE